MKKRIYRGILALAVLTMVLVFAICLMFFNYIWKEQAKEELSVEAAYVSRIYEEAQDIAGFCALFADFGKARVTLLDPDGAVLYDNEASASEMENHLERPEVQEALKSGQGFSNRLSETLREETFYQAILLADGNILRVALQKESSYQIFRKILPLLFAVALVLLVSSLLAARQITRGIVASINKIDLKEPMNQVPFPELTPLLSRMENQKRQIDRQMKELLEQERKFNTITTNMNEGLILLDQDSRILFLNQSLKDTLGAGKMDYTGKSISLFSRSREMTGVIEAAKAGRSTDERITFYEKKLHVYGNPVYEEDKINGVVLFLVDVSEKEQADAMRREFTANVSHELKTPLTSISGFAEIIENGMAKPEDVPVFAGKIREEAGRLLILINDILKLSRMDEGRIIQPKEMTDLSKVGREVQERLLPIAEKQGIAFTVAGDPVQVLAVRSMIYDMIYNLCDNAIKYNRENGKVLLEIYEKEERPVIRVTDTGIGIPAEHQERIFERFYRVDKSHSRQTGGTGLGLSIVKHVVEYHGGYIEVHSREGVGTAITIHL